MIKAGYLQVLLEPRLTWLTARFPIGETVRFAPFCVARVLHNLSPLFGEMTIHKRQLASLFMENGYTCFG